MAKEGAKLSGAEPVDRARGTGQRAETEGRGELRTSRGKSIERDQFCGLEDE